MDELNGNTGQQKFTTFTGTTRYRLFTGGIVPYIPQLN